MSNKINDELKEWHIAKLQNYVDKGLLTKGEMEKLLKEDLDMPSAEEESDFSYDQDGNSCVPV